MFKRRHKFLYERLTLHNPCWHTYAVALISIDENNFPQVLIKYDFNRKKKLFSFRLLQNKVYFKIISKIYKA